MNDDDNTLRRSVLLGITAVVFLVYALTGAAFGSRMAVEGANVLLLAIASGVVVAYAPDALGPLRKRLLHGTDVLAFGIFVGWAAVVLARAVAVAWRLSGKPDAWEDSWWWGLHVAGSTVAATCHLFAPKAVAGRVPTWQWIRVGMVVAGAVFVAAGIMAISSGG